MRRKLCHILMVYPNQAPSLSVQCCSSLLIQMQYIKKQVQSGNLELARFNTANQPVPMQYSELEQKKDIRNRQTAILQKLQTLSPDEKMEWMQLKKLRANELYKAQKWEQAIELYLQTLLGLDISKETDPQVQKSNNQFKYSILLNIATCLYKQGHFQRGVEICNKILQEQDGKLFTKAYYKKACLLIAAADYEQARTTILQGRKYLQRVTMEPSARRISADDFALLLRDIDKKMAIQKSVYKKMFTEQDEQEEKLLKDCKEKEKKMDQEQNKDILYYDDSFWGKVWDCCCGGLQWTRGLLRLEKSKKK